MPKQNFYAVRKGRQNGVYLTWAECEAQISQYPGAVFKKFPSAAEAEAFVRSVPLSVAEQQTSALSEEGWRGRKRAFSNFVDESEWLVVYSDGACKGNGRADPIAGIGVYWGPDDPRNIAERCPGDQTNNRAELIAIIRVLETVAVNKRKLLIKTDSKYSISCFEQWLPKWRENGFQTANGSPVKNPGIIKYLSALLEERGKRGQQVRLQYVKGHSGDPGNDGADAQANVGATLPPRLDLDWETLETRASETITALTQPMDVRTTNTLETETRTADTGLPSERPAKISRSSPLSTKPVPMVGKTLSRTRASVSALTSATRPARSPFQPAAPSTNLNKPTIYEKPIYQATSSGEGPSTAPTPSPPPVTRPQTPPTGSSYDLNSRPQLLAASSRYNQSSPPKELLKPPVSPRSPLRVSEVAPPLVPVSVNNIDFDLYKDCLLEGEEWAKEIENL